MTKFLLTNFSSVTLHNNNNKASIDTVLLLPPLIPGEVHILIDKLPSAAAVFLLRLSTMQRWIISSPSYQNGSRSIQNLFRIGTSRKALFATKAKKSQSQTCPFELLGVHKESQYKVVKKAFLKLAMTTHPDVIMGSFVGSEEEVEREKARAEKNFVQARLAFERIRPLECGKAVLVDGDGGLDQVVSDEAVDKFDDWFYSETGKQPIGSFQLDRETVMEVAKMEGEVQHGLDRDGGMWHLAGMIANSVKEGGKDAGAASVLKLTMGDGEEDTGPTKRRRRRRGR